MTPSADPCTPHRQPATIQPFLEKGRSLVRKIVCEKAGLIPTTN
jgi:hypothetical protein